MEKFFVREETKFYRIGYRSRKTFKKFTSMRKNARIHGKWQHNSANVYSFG